MNISIPIYVQHHKRYTIRPLFQSYPQRSHPSLERALHLLTSDLRDLLRDLGRYSLHEELAEWTFCPKMEHQRVEVQIELRKSISRCRFLFVLMKGLGRRIAFTPAMPDLWFEIARGENLQARASEALTEHFRRLEKEDEGSFIEPTRLALRGTAWVHVIEMEVYPKETIKDPDEDLRAFLGSREKLDGEHELFRVGRCLDALYPDDLDRVVLRDHEIEELTRLLRYSDRRPVMLLGAPLVGKTALIHEHVFRTVSKRKRRHRVRRYLWHISPQRLISGMSYVGQWENRLLAILRECEKKQHILYFDDFLGLYLAGKHSQSDLSVAHVLKPYVEQRKVRIISEMTPEAFRVLREQDRGFADLFHVLPVKEPSEEDNLKIQISVQRQLEGQNLCKFDLDVLPLTLDLQRRYVRHLSFPGKSAGFLRRLAVKHRQSRIPRHLVLEEFHNQSGLSLAFLDDRAKLERSTILSQLQKQVIGQQEALESAADVVSVAKARLNDQDRPLASMLFLGPTGVGKTQTAKAIACYLFGDADKLLRFDMNEYAEPGTAAQLVGTFHSPEGLLTTAVRRQPFSVILFDEIEKAEGDVFDLLLQVLGEGRLTDALGRTADFSNTIIVLTSNLGVRQASTQFGFREGEQENRHIYEQAAERFFRPEFFNRLDRIVPFERLTLEQIQKIARMLIDDLLKREGLIRRKCILRVSDEAMLQVAESGFDPVLGARALKRSLERQIAQPIATRLAEGLPESLTVLNVSAGDGALKVDVQTLENVDTLNEGVLTVDRSHSEPLLRQARIAIRRMEETIAPMRPEGEITRESLEGEHYRYFAVQEQLQSVRGLLKAIDEHVEASKQTQHSFPSLPLPTPFRWNRFMKRTWGKYSGASPLSLPQNIWSVEDVHQYLEDLASDLEPREEALEESLLHLLQELAQAHVLTEASQSQEGEHVAVMVHVPVGGFASMGFATSLSMTLREELKLEVIKTQENWDHKYSVYCFEVRGPGASQIVSLEQGTHLWVLPRGNLAPTQVFVWPLEPGQNAQQLAVEKLDQRRQWQTTYSRGEAGLDEDPLPWLPLVRLYNLGASTIDLRTGMVTEELKGLGGFIKSALPLPPEMMDL